MRICNKCKEELSEDMFSKNKNGKNGLHTWCKCCVKQYYQNNKEAIALYGKQYNQDHKEARAAHKKQYRQDNKEAIAIKAKQWRQDNAVYEKQRRQENKEAMVVYGKQYRQENKEKKKQYRQENKIDIAAKTKQYYQENKADIATWLKQYRQENKEAVALQKARYQKNHLEECRIRNQRRSAKKRLLPSTLTVEQWEQIRLYFNNRCCYCNRELPLTQEHLIALSKGGEYSHNNIIPSCLSCNCSKGSKSLNDWYPTYEHYSKKREQKILKFLNYSNGIQQLTFM